MKASMPGNSLHYQGSSVRHLYPDIHSITRDPNESVYTRQFIPLTGLLVKGIYPDIPSSCHFDENIPGDTRRCGVRRWRDDEKITNMQEVKCALSLLAVSNSTAAINLIPFLKEARESHPTQLYIQLLFSLSFVWSPGEGRRRVGFGLEDFDRVRFQSFGEGRWPRWWWQQLGQCGLRFCSLLGLQLHILQQRSSRRGLPVASEGALLLWWLHLWCLCHRSLGMSSSRLLRVPFSHNGRCFRYLRRLITICFFSVSLSVYFFQILLGPLGCGCYDERRRTFWGCIFWLLEGDEIELEFREPKRLMGPKVYQDGVQEANSVGIEVFTVEKVLEVEVI